VPTDQDLRYAVRVQDAQLKELQRNIRALNKDLSASERTATSTGTAGATGFNRWDQSAKKAAGSTRILGSSVAETAKLGAAAGAGFLAYQKLESFLRGSIPAAQESEASLVRLNTQLTAVGLSTDEYSGKIEKAVTAQTLLAGKIDDELVRDSLTNLLRSTRNVTTAINLNALAMDIAIAKNISLETASRLVARVYAGNTGALGRYGIVIDKTASSTEALTILQQRFGGQAAAAGKTAEGEFGRFHYRVEELQESIGSGLIPVLSDLAESAELAFVGLDKLHKIDVTPGFNLPDLPEGLKSYLRVAPVSPALGVALAVKKTVDGLKDANDEASIFDRLAGAIGKDFDGIVGSVDRSAKAIETKLRTALSKTLEDVHTKALAIFDRETDALLTANDRQTDDLLRAFDKTTDQMLERMRVLVKVGEEQFRIGANQKTPAERELEALDKIEQKRNLARETTDAREALAQAELIGDPKAIQDAKRRLQDVETERKKVTLEARAKTEREVANKALAAEQERIRELRDKQRQGLSEERSALRDHLAERRGLLRENLDKELTAIQTALAKGKRAAANAQEQTLAVLRKYGADYAKVGDDLGTKFLEAFTKAITPKKRPLVEPGEGRLGGPRKGAARGGIAGTLGTASSSDTVPALLTPGEIILNRSQQTRLARRLGMPSAGPHALFGAIARFASGGVAGKTLDPPFGMNRHGPRAYSVYGSRGTFAPIRRDISDWLERFYGRGLSPAAGKHIAEWWSDNFRLIARGYASGGVIDDEEFRELLARLSGEAGTDYVRRSHLRQTFASANFLTGKGMTDAQRRLLSPIHLQSKLKSALGDRYATADRATKLRLLGELAQRQAHVVRSGLVRIGPNGAQAGDRFHDPGRPRGSTGVAGGTSFTFGDLNVTGGPELTAEEIARQIAPQIRRELNGVAIRNGRRRRGRNAGSIAGLRQA
jgi:hypothetical protein